MVQPTPEIDAFIERIQALAPGPGISLDAALRPSLNEEAELRRLFATDRQNPRLSYPFVGLVDVFAAPDAIRVTRARVVQGKEDLCSQYVMPLSENWRRKEGAPCMVADLEEFKTNWAIFTEGSLFQLFDWSHVVAAGGSVLACLSPLDEEHKKSKRTIRKYYHTDVYPTSDVDLFLWGLNAEQAEAKIKQIYEAVRDSVPWDVTCIRTKHTVSIYCQYPYRSVQIVLRLYHSPAEILAGFDIDSPCCAYDGNRVWANPRAIVATMRQCNTVDVTRRSPSYEVRFAKYAERGYEVYVPTLNRDGIDPTIFERSIIRVKGLARLLVLEKLKDDRLRAWYLRERRQLRDRPTGIYKFPRHKYKGDLKQKDNLGLEMNSYDVGPLHIPYGPRWDARRIDKLVYQTDLGMNSTFNPKNKGRRLHRHAAFFGTGEEVLEDCCEHCSRPIDKDEEELRKKEDESYIRGRIRFIEENPGRQLMTGSFNPIDEGEWSEQAYVHPTTLLFQAIVSHDRATLQRLLKDGVNLHLRDHVGRTALHVAILVKAVEIAEDLIDAGARITARLADGRAPLHLAAQYDLPRLINKLLERSENNQFDLEKSVTDRAQVAPERPSSEDDWSSHDDEDIVKSFSEGGDDEQESEGGREHGGKERDGHKTCHGKQEDRSPTQQDDVPDDVLDEPDIIDVNVHCWDFGFSPLCYAVLYGSLPILETLLAAGSDPKSPTTSSSTTSNLKTPFHPLTLTIIRKDDSRACEMAESLIKAGATSTTADSSVRTIFHSFVSSGRTRLVETVLRCDPNVDKVINLPYLERNNVMFPVVTAIQLRSYATLMAMVAHGARLDLQETDTTKARDAASEDTRRSVLQSREVGNYLHLACQPVEVALRQNDDVAQLIISLGATVDFVLKRCLEGYFRRSPGGTVKLTVKDWVELALKQLTERILKRESELSAPSPSVSQAVDSPKVGWQAFLKEYEDGLEILRTNNAAPKAGLEAGKHALEDLKDTKAYILEIRDVLSQNNAKTWGELYPTEEPKVQSKILMPPSSPDSEGDWVYVYWSKGRYSYHDERVPQHLIAAYDELFEACYNGDNEKIQELCLPDCKPEANTVEEGESPLNISVRYVTKPTGFQSHYPDWGYTPLSAAVAGRRWPTAKLVLAIAAAQYEPGEFDDKIEFSIDVIDDESDTESMDSDITIDQEQVRFVDIATRSSQIRSRIHPTKLLDTPVPYCKPRRNAIEGGPASAIGQALVIQLAVIRSDLDSFVHIANLYESLPQTVELPDLIDTILEHDQVQILNEYIRRTAKGIDIVGAQLSARVGPIPIAINDENKIYLGLNVHGKKRVDLARKNDPNAVVYSSAVRTPLVWKAARAKAVAIVSYLGSDGPLSAYRHYASVHSDSKAIFLRRLGANKGELEKWLPKWLGWSCEGIGESPLSAAIVGGDVEMVKLVAKLNPKLFSQSIQTEIKFLGLNPLLLAVGSSGDIKVIEFLLINKVSPSQRDAIRGWNIYHYICSANKGHLLKFFLDKLPRDVNESLLAQQSRRRGNTPLHLAVKGGKEALVSILLNYTQDGLLVRDVDGQTPLHCAVGRSFSTIVDHLLRVIPKEGLVMENSVGNTPTEIIVLAELLQCCKELSNLVSPGQQSSGSMLNQVLNPDFIYSDARIPAAHFSKYEAELKDLMEIVPEMVDRGTVVDERKRHMKNEIQNWVNKLLIVFNAAKQREELREAERKTRRDEEETEKRQKGLPDVNPYPTDTADLKKTFELMMKAYKAGPNNFQQRRLIHLLDVQKSVGCTLTTINPDNEFADAPQIRIKGRYYPRKSTDLEDYEAHAESEESEVETFLVFDFFETTSDPW